MRAVIHWTLIAAMALGLSWTGVEAGRRLRDARPDSPLLVLQARYVVGAARLMGSMGGPDPTDELIESLDTLARTDVDRVRVITVMAEVVGPAVASERIGQLKVEGPLREDLDTLSAIYSGTPPSDTARLVERHGWFGRLAASHGRSDEDPARAEVLADASRTFFTVLGGMFMAGTAGVAGLVIFIIALVLLSSRRVRFAHAPPAPKEADTVWLEAVNLFFMVALANALAVLLIGAHGMLSLASLVFLALIVFWPRLRGVDAGEWRRSIGYHRGRGWVREVLCGALGYLAGIPLILLGVLVSVLLVQVFELETSHPMIEDLGEGGVFGLLFAFLAACVWAPVVEESVFRGMLYRYVRPRLSAVLSSLLTGLIFAVVHPQGLAGIPPILAVGFVLAMIREWRGSLIASMVAHGMHNFAVLTYLIIGMS